MLHREQDTTLASTTEISWCRISIHGRHLNPRAIAVALPLLAPLRGRLTDKFARLALVSRPKRSFSCMPISFRRVQIVGAGLLAIGFLSRPTAAAMSATMITAVVFLKVLQRFNSPQVS